MTYAPPAAPTFGEPVPQAASAETLDFLARRRSASAASLAAPAPDAAELATLLRLASRVPDHGKLAPWRFIILEGEDKAGFVTGLECIARARGDERAVMKLAKVRNPPLGVAVIASPKDGDIPEWEQTLSAGAVCAQLLIAAGAMGYGANWITDWYAYDGEALRLLGLHDHEKVAGFIFIGTPAEPPLERQRMEVDALMTRWGG